MKPNFAHNLTYLNKDPRKGEYDSFLSEWSIKWLNRGKDNFNPKKKMNYSFTFSEVMEILKQNPSYKNSYSDLNSKDYLETIYLRYLVRESDSLTVNMTIFALPDSIISYAYAIIEINNASYNGHLTFPTRLSEKNQDAIALLIKMDLSSGDSRLAALYERHLNETSIRIAVDQREEHVEEFKYPEQTEVEKDTCDGIRKIVYNDAISAAISIAIRDGLF
jgi:hypothetical protein